MHRSLIEKKVMKFNIDPKIQLENIFFFSQEDNFYPAAIFYPKLWKFSICVEATHVADFFAIKLSSSVPFPTITFG